MYIKNLNPKKTLKDSWSVMSVEIYDDKVEIMEFYFAISMVQG